MFRCTVLRSQHQAFHVPTAHGWQDPRHVGLVGGQAKFQESAFEGLKREITEEVGTPPTFKKVIPLELFTSNDQKFFFNTYVIAVQDEFLPRLNHEHSSYAWCAFECWPKNLHAGLRNTLNNKSIKGKLQTILDLIV